MEKNQLLTYDGLKWNYFQSSGNSIVIYAWSKHFILALHNRNIRCFSFFIRASTEPLKSAVLTTILSRHQVYPTLFNTPLLPATCSGFTYIDLVIHTHIRFTSEKVSFPKHIENI